MARFCERCGQPLGDNSNFCGSCGNPVTEMSSESNGGWNDAYVEDKGIYEKFFTHKGRLNRKRYFFRVACLFAIAVLVQFICVELVSGDYSNIDELEQFYLSAGDYVGLAALIVSFVIFAFLNVAEIMITIRRLHDLGHTGWLALVTFIPFVNFVFGIYLLFALGTRGPNIYGPDPLSYR